jgi:hypothetical protein
MMKCPICEMKFYDPNRNENIFSTTSCGHVYHKDCLLNWIQQNNSCPICRESCDESSIVQLFLSANFENDDGGEVLDVLGTRISDLQIGVNSRIEEMASLFGNIGVSFSTYESQVTVCLKLIAFLFSHSISNPNRTKN